MYNLIATSSLINNWNKGHTCFTFVRYSTVSYTDDGAEFRVMKQLWQTLIALLALYRGISASKRLHLAQNNFPQFRQWCLLSVMVNLVLQAVQLSPLSSRIQWSTIPFPGWSLTDQLKTRPLSSPTNILMWSFEMANAVTAAGLGLSFLSNAVCIVSLLRNTNCLCHLKPGFNLFLWAADRFSCTFWSSS